MSQKNMKKPKSGISRLLEISAQKSGLLIAAVIFSTLPGIPILLSIIKGIAVFILPLGTLILMQNPNSLSFALSVGMFLILSPGIVAPIFKVVGIGGVVRDLSSGVERIDMIFLTLFFGTEVEKK